MTQFNKLTLASTDALPNVIVSELSHWGLMTATGEQRLSYLQGQLTCDLVGLEDQQTTWGGHCDPKGKLWSTFQVAKKGNSFYFIMRKDALAITLPELKKYAVFSKVELTDASAFCNLYGVAGEQAEQWLNKTFAMTLGEEAVTHLPNGFVMRLIGETPRFLVLLQKSDASLQQISQHLAEAATDDGSFWDALDILAAAPIVSVAMSSVQIPQAFNLQAYDGISFKKGCYTGQETVARAKYRGTNKRAMAILTGATATEVNSGDNIELQLGENWRSSGKVNLSYRYSDGVQLISSVMPNNLEADSVFKITDNESTLAFMPLPYSLVDAD
ncbi:MULTISPECIES: tRNA-modifying protein YgfZ [unclassified Moritella]|uniref:tRNA-modifying protein YgfZ n=1 Tax=unclassified Moritella TaxID=2637987 RepID=UPI001BAAA430|nr:MULTISPECIES: tRNA-modifying protein YgfZ [unclassified Moritella]QUM86698.1 tRNA-modifying protein YgfZ [Moritella sp. 28]QUM90925.1 tRNA-modifying protein YgfZ [Moritella sp. 36]